MEMTLTEAKKHFFNEDSLSLSVASEEDIQALATWLEANDYDADYAWRLHDMGSEEMRCIMASAAEEFAEFL
jgi:hypothetical protein